MQDDYNQCIYLRNSATIAAYNSIRLILMNIFLEIIFYINKLCIVINSKLLERTLFYLIYALLATFLIVFSYPIYFLFDVIKMDS